MFFATEVLLIFDYLTFYHMWKKFLLGLLGLCILLVLVGFLLPGKFEVTKSLTIQAPAAYSFEEVNGLENWEKWSYWNTLDTGMQVTYGETRAGVGGWYSWESEDLGSGKLLITESVPNSSIKADLMFMESDTAKAWYTFEPDGDGTKLTMGMSTDFGMNPIARWYGFAMMRSEMDKAFDHNLAQLKALAEGKPKFSVLMAEETVQPVSYIGLATTMSPKDMNAVSKQMEKMYTELFTALQKAKVEMQGHPFSMYPKWSTESMDMVCALPVSADAKLPAKYKVMQTQGGKAVKATHMGNYDNLQATHDELNRYIEYKKFEYNGAPWEVYVTDPMVEKDTAKWITEIYYPVK
jgi:effector-binding domain-containing protein